MNNQNYHIQASFANLMTFKNKKNPFIAVLHANSMAYMVTLDKPGRKRIHILGYY